MTDRRRTAHAIFRRYRAMPGSEQIATRFALEGLMRWTRRCRPHRILEIGVGLGTLTEALRVAAPLAMWTGIERNPMFRRVPARPGVVAQITPSRLIDLLVVDDDLNSYEATTLVADLTPRATCFFEGNRTSERRAVAGALLSAGYRWVETNWRPLGRSKGYWIFQLDPTRSERARFAARRAWERGLDLILCPLLGVTPGWRRRDSDPAA